MSRTPLNLIIKHGRRSLLIGKRHKYVHQVNVLTSPKPFIKLVDASSASDPLWNFVKISNKIPELELTVEFRHSSSSLGWFYPEFYKFKCEYGQLTTVNLLSD